MHQIHWFICFSAKVHRYHSNNGYGDIPFGSSSHSSSDSSIPLLLQFESNLEVVSHNYAL